MDLLFTHSIQGAEHDSSAHSPPPRCHPDTCIQINNHIRTWFYNEEKNELLLWVYGPAGVGKSAIMQTLADKLAKSKHLGASAFVSRPNGRNNSRQLIITIAYQLAVHIEEYCTFVTEKLSRDPSLVTKGMEEQFKTFIVEPFVERRIGAGGHPWGIILDGLHELDEHQSQREIIHLVADFVVQHPDVPILWAIASRPLTCSTRRMWCLHA
jgi:Cdc6-like AAA superfamily ATPase